MNKKEIKKRLKEIEKEFFKIEIISKEIYKQWDSIKNKNPDNEQIKKYFGLMEFYRIEFEKLYREQRMIMPYELRNDIKKGSDVMKLTEFVEYINCNALQDYDGFGFYVKNGKETNIIIHPSDIKHGATRKEFDTVSWFK